MYTQLLYKIENGNKNYFKGKETVHYPCGPM